MLRSAIRILASIVGCLWRRRTVSSYLAWSTTKRCLLHRWWTALVTPVGSTCIGLINGHLRLLRVGRRSLSVLLLRCRLLIWIATTSILLSIVKSLWCSLLVTSVALIVPSLALVSVALIISSSSSLTTTIGIVATAASSSSERVIWPTLNDGVNHLFSTIHTLSCTLDGYFTICTRWDILIDLNVCSGTFLKVINGHSFRTNDSSHELLLCVQEISECVGSTLVSVRKLLVASRASCGSIWRRASRRSSAVSAPSRPTCTTRTLIHHFGPHVCTLIGQICVGWPTSPLSATAKFVVHQKLDALHCFHEWICH
mmetsp:Transcript_1684/g.3582  ORF Transcript_1684/g.3582 Transcript_1684/m.3582 type:complete len:313 (-) Transcript_1684:866-1804(-)